MSNWNNPILTSAYADHQTDLKGRDLDLAKGMDPAKVTVTNPVVDMLRWNSASRKWQMYDGGSWVVAIDYYDIELKAFTGDVTKPAGSSALTIATAAVTSAKLRDSAAVSVIGRSANSSGVPGDIAAGANDTFLRRVGDALGFGGLTLGMVADALLTYAKLQNVSATDKVLGRSTAGAGVIEEIACTATGRSLLAAASASAALAVLIPAGTRMLFQQTSAPTGWTKETSATYNDSILRFVTGSVATGGSVAFGTLFGTSKTTDATTLTTSQIPSHTHTLPVSANTGSGTAFPSGGGFIVNGAAGQSTGSAGTGGSHTHPMANLNIKYAGVIIATKA